MGKILLVDDNDDFLEALKPSLELAGFQVVLARSGLEALTLIKGGTLVIDCVLTDYQMPEMRGDELAAAIKHSTDIPVIIMTGDSTISMDRLFKSGISGIINKPFDSRNFIEFLKNNELHLGQELIKQRKFLRQRSAQKVHKITLSNGRQTIEGDIVNISSGGLGVVMVEALSPKSTVQFTLTLDGDSIKGYMHIRWESQSEKGFKAGFEFDSLTKKSLAKNAVFSQWITISMVSASAS